MSAISEERRKAWQTLIESTDMTHNSKKAWSTIRMLCDDPCKPKQHCNTTANQVAHQLLLNGRVPNRQPKVRLDRQRYPDDPGFTRAFTAAELDIGIRVLRTAKHPAWMTSKRSWSSSLDPRHATGYFVFLTTVLRLRQFRRVVVLFYACIVLCIMYMTIQPTRLPLIWFVYICKIWR